MRIAIFFFLCLMAHIAAANGPETKEEVRNLYYQATEDKKTVGDLVKRLEALDGSKPLWMGYRGMSHMLQAKHAVNPYKKLVHFNDGRDMLDKAIELDPENVELRFLRLSVQLNAPQFLNYTEQKDEDFEFILDEWGEIKDKDLQRRIQEFIYSSELDSKETREKMLGS